MKRSNRNERRLFTRLYCFSISCCGLSPGYGLQFAVAFLTSNLGKGGMPYDASKAASGDRVVPIAERARLVTRSPDSALVLA